MDFSHGDVDAHEPTPGSFDAFADGAARGGAQAGSYLFPGLPRLRLPPDQFVAALRQQAGVTVTPGTEFSPDTADTIRLNVSQAHAPPCPRPNASPSWCSGIAPERQDDPIRPGECLSVRLHEQTVLAAGTARGAAIRADGRSSARPPEG